MNNSAAKVGEIFTEAGVAFNKLADLTMLLHPIADTTPSVSTKTPVKRKIVDDKSTTSTVTSGQGQQNIHKTPIAKQVTLNMLNAQGTEIDVDALDNDVKLEFESSTEEMTS